MSSPTRFLGIRTAAADDYTYDPIFSGSIESGRVSPASIDMTQLNSSHARDPGLHQPHTPRAPGLKQPPAGETGLNQRLETILNEAERRALVAVLRSRPDLTLDKLQDCFTGRYGATLRTITVRELLETEIDIELPDDGGPLVDRSALEQAKRLNGQAFDACVLEAICSAGGEPVSASYLRARVGGPRWKLQNSLRRLVDAGEVERDGVTSSTRYRAIRS
jgi:hypothetical protein